MPAAIPLGALALALALSRAVPLPAELRGTVVVSDRSEVRVRDSNELTGRALDLETSPALDVRLEGRRWSLDTAYAPRFTGRALDESAAATRDLLHRGAATATYADRRVRFVAREELFYGSQSYTSLALGTSPVAAPAPGQPSLQTLYGPATILYTSMRTNLSARVEASRDVAVTSTFEHVRSGGIDALSRTVLPLQEGPRVEESVEYAASRADWLTTSARGDVRSSITTTPHASRPASRNGYRP